MLASRRGAHHVCLLARVARQVWTVDAGYTLDSLVLSTPDDPLPAQLREAWKAKHAREVRGGVAEGPRHTVVSALPAAA